MLYKWKSSNFRSFLKPHSIQTVGIESSVKKYARVWACWNFCIFLVTFLANFKFQNLDDPPVKYVCVCCCCCSYMHFQFAFGYNISSCWFVLWKLTNDYFKINPDFNFCSWESTTHWHIKHLDHLEQIFSKYVMRAYSVWALFWVLGETSVNEIVKAHSLATCILVLWLKKYLPPNSP